MAKVTAERGYPDEATLNQQFHNLPRRQLPIYGSGLKFGVARRLEKECMI